MTRPRPALLIAAVIAGLGCSSSREAPTRAPLEETRSAPTPALDAPPFEVAPPITVTTSHRLDRPAAEPANWWEASEIALERRVVSRGGAEIAVHIRYRVPAIPEPRSLAFGYGSVCALVADQSVWCWGEGLGGELGRPAPGPRRLRRPARVAGVEADALFALLFTMCARSDSRWTCWGENHRWHGDDDRFLGPGATRLEVPAPIRHFDGYVELVAGAGDIACGRRAGGEVRCWGVTGHTAARPATLPGSARSLVTHNARVFWASADGKRLIRTHVGPERLETEELFRTDAPMTRLVASSYEICALDEPGALHCHDLGPIAADAVELVGD